MNHGAIADELARFAARTDTWAYPRSACGRCVEFTLLSLSVVFHAASSIPSASQLRVASRCRVQNDPREPMSFGVVIIVVSWLSVRGSSIALKTSSFGDENQANRRPIVAKDGGGLLPSKRADSAMIQA
jgi:hypothetical protein